MNRKKRHLYFASVRARHGGEKGRMTYVVFAHSTPEALRAIRKERKRRTHTVPARYVVRLTILLSWLVASPASAAEVIEALGGEKCGGAARSYSVEFLAPENAQVEARGKVMIGGKEVPDTPGLSLDDKPCPDGRCSFRATKGQTYKLTVESTAQGSNELCVSVARP